ncbi:pentatricopeptide repeat-containing protein At1g06140, mitochondrial-like [Pyrus communis]|uniref:pentatricopeptide repeat-containing protein At1g06140, mitochondrial-like n=1 Tax=Pyrus communis TaxID=23211 RepID=UPI0035C08247
MNRIKSGFGSLASKTQIRFLCTSVLDDPRPQSPFLSENLASFLDNCSDAFSLRKLHARIFPHGLGNNIFLGCKLLNCYAKFDLLSDSRWVFDRIVNGNLSLWNAILVGYFRAGQFDEVLWRYVDLRRWNIGLDSDAITFGLKSCIELGDLGFGRGIHGDALKSGFSSNGFVGSSLIGLHTRCGLIDDASKVFDEITERDALSLRKLHVRIFAHGLGNNIFLGCKLLNCYAKFDLLSDSRWVFDRIVNGNLSLWNAILVGYFRAGQFDEVLRRYVDLRRWNIGLDSGAITFGLKSCIELGDLGFGRGIHGDALKSGFSSNGFAGSSLIGLYFRCGFVEDAAEVFDEITGRDIVAQSGDQRACEAFGFARRMQRQGLHPNRVTLVSLLQAASQLEVLKEGRSVHGYTIRRGIGGSDEVFETSPVDISTMVEGGQHKSLPAAHKCIFHLLNILGVLLQVKHATGNLPSPFVIDHNTVVMLIADLLTYAGTLQTANILQASNNTNIYELMNNISLLCGTLALVLLVLLLVPAFGWFTLACWAIYFVIIGTKSYQTLRTLCADVIRYVCDKMKEAMRLNGIDEPQNQNENA